MKSVVFRLWTRGPRSLGASTERLTKSAVVSRYLGECCQDVRARRG